MWFATFCRNHQSYPCSLKCLPKLCHLIWAETKVGGNTVLLLFERDWPDRVWRHPAADSDSCVCSDTNSETIRFFFLSGQAHVSQCQLNNLLVHLKIWSFVYGVDTWPMYRQLQQHQHAGICFKELRWVHSVYFRASLVCSDMMSSRKVRFTLCECARRAQMEGGYLKSEHFSEDGKAW